MNALDRFEVWLITGSQHLYGDAVLGQVAEQSRQVAAGLAAAAAIPVSVVHKPPVTSPESIRALLLEANASERCVGLIVWMHTFSPAKMWIAGLRALQKPLLHLHTQFNRELPWAEIDMDFMNLNQSAHGDREFGYLATRMRLRRKTVAGHWTEPSVLERIGTWSRAACGWHEAQSLRVARFGDNMRQVAVTEGDKVEAQIRLGVSVNGYGVGELASAVDDVDDASVDRLVAEYEDALRARSRADGRAASSGSRCAMRRGSKPACAAFLDAGGFKAFTTTFEDLGGLRQLPGIAVQRLMADGYGFGAEGDWKTAALVRVTKVMSAGPRGRHLVHGGLHLPPRAGRSEGARRPHARGVPVDQRRQAELRDPPALDRRPPGPRAARLHGGARAGRRRRLCSISATASGSSRTRSRSSRPRRSYRACRSRGRSGGRSRASQLRPRGGSRPAALTTRASRRR